MKIKNKQRLSAILGVGMALALSINFPMVNVKADIETPYYIIVFCYKQSLHKF